MTRDTDISPKGASGTGAGAALVRDQIAVLPWRIDKGKVEVCIITSRETGRWIVPKGWPMKGHSRPGAARIEAWEEAGLIGRVSERPLGQFRYDKRMPDGAVPVLATLYAMRVKRSVGRYPERRQRRRQWLSPKKAAERLDDADLARIVRDFRPRALPG